MQLQIKVFCFFASYVLALLMELWYLFRPRLVWRRLGQIFGLAGLLSQTYFLVAKGPPLASQYGWMLFTAWILAFFYLFGSLHYHRLAWGIFVLPVIIGLVALGDLGAQLNPQSKETRENQLLFEELSLKEVHGLIILLASIGICVGFIASLMYLYQARRLRMKRLPRAGLNMLSLERLEQMNRRAIILSFPLLTIGMLLGLVLMFNAQIHEWTDPRVISTFVLWLAFAVLLYLRFGTHLRGRHIALWTVVTFGLLIVCICLSHFPASRGLP